MTRPAHPAPGNAVGNAVLRFGQGEVVFALPAMLLAEIIRPRPLTRVPHSPPCLLGVINLRGTILPVVSLAGLLGLPEATPGPNSRILVLAQSAQVPTGPVGLLVERVGGIAADAAATDTSLDPTALLARAFATARPARLAGGGSTRVPAEAAADSATGHRALLGFAVSGQDYALALADLIAVAGAPPGIAALPGTDAAMLGVIPWRDRVLPVVSLAALLGLGSTHPTTQTQQLIVTRLGTALVGLLADAVQAILRVPEGAIDSVPLVLTRGTGEARIAAICRLDRGARLVSLLDPARLFDATTTARIVAASQQGDAGMDDAKAAGERAGSIAQEQFVIFRLGPEQYGLPIAAVAEVVRCPASFTRVPCAPEFLAGVMNLRGRILPVIDQRRRFAVPGAPPPSGRRVLVVTIGGQQAGFVVDTVSEVLSIAADELCPAPDFAARDSAPGSAHQLAVFDRIASIERDGRMILLVDALALLDRTERDLLAAVAAQQELSDAGAP